MARKTEVVRITTEGRDFGKTFLLTEMPASQAEAWAARALLGLGKSGLDVPDQLPDGMMGIYILGTKVLAGIDWQVAKPLMDEMFACIRIIPSPDKPEITRQLIEDDIEEVQTRWTLRERIISLHLGFSLAARISIYHQSLTAARSTGPTTSTSPEPLAESSQAA